MLSVVRRTVATGSGTSTIVNSVRRGRSTNTGTTSMEHGYVAVRQEALFFPNSSRLNNRIKRHYNQQYNCSASTVWRTPASIADADINSRTQHVCVQDDKIRLITTKPKTSRNFGFGESLLSSQSSLISSLWSSSLLGYCKYDAHNQSWRSGKNIRLSMLLRTAAFSSEQSTNRLKNSKPVSNSPLATATTIAEFDNSTAADNDGKISKNSSKTEVLSRSKSIPSMKIAPTPVPTPPSSPQKRTTPKSILGKAIDLTISVFQSVFRFVFALPANMWHYITNPKDVVRAWDRLKEVAKEEAHHYWVGTKLLWADIQTARKLLGKTLEGTSLTRRERKQMLRTVSDLFRLIPFSMFVLIPFMEFALPFALRIFPNMLPSTYQDSLKAEENMKRELKSRIAMTQFFQETLEELAKEQKRKAANKKKELEEAGVNLETGETTIQEQKASAQSMLEFLEKARSGEIVPPDVIIRYANYFQDDLTLDNMPRMQLINMCKYMGIQPYGADAFLRFQLRHKIRVLKEDDQRILWEGIGSLTKMELREACQERGMRSTGLSKESYRKALQQWLDLSVNKDVPISLLIMSRTFFLNEEMVVSTGPSSVDSGTSLSELADAISGLDKEVLNEVILEVATKEEKQSDPEVRKIKLEVVSQQNEMIREEQEARDAVVKKKEEAAAKKEEAVAAAAVETAAKEKELNESASKEHRLEENTQNLDIKVASDSVSMEHDVSSTTNSENARAKKSDDDTALDELSAEEMDAITQLVSEDPVCKEREELEKIKADMKEDLDDGKDEKLEVTTSSEQPILGEEDITAKPVLSETETKEPLTAEEADNIATNIINKLDDQAAAAADSATIITVGVNSPAEVDESSGIAETHSENEMDPIVAKLKKRVESMVDKIEVQLSETEVKIGDKLHHLDKDRDGILTREEMASAIQQVLKRKISFEEATEIANQMDGNEDGVFTVDEMIKWIENHKIVKFVEEGRDADIDRIIASKSSAEKHQLEDEPSSTDGSDDTKQQPQPVDMKK